MSMASMVQNYPPHEHARDQYSFEGYGGASNSAAFMASHFAFNSTAPATTVSPCSDHKLNGAHADAMWAPIKTIPSMEGPFTPSAPLITPPSLICTHAAAADPSSYMDAITRSCTPTEILAFNPSSAFDIDFPLSEENQLLELMGLQRKLSFYSSHGDDDHDLSPGSIAAAADDERESFAQARSYGDAVRLGNLARSLTFPPAGGLARTDQSSCAARSPLILSSDAAGARNSENIEKHFNYKRAHRENSSAATTSCSNGDENELHKGKNARVKLEVPEVSQCMQGGHEQQGCIEQRGTTLNSRSYKQNKKRVANMSNSNTSAKVARIETPPDVVHVRARRGQATDSHSLAERVRREKISQRMKVLQEIVPGCHKVLGKAMMLDEIINYVKSLQKQVEFLSMKLAAANQASTITNEVKFLLPNMEFFGDFSSSCQAMKSKPLMISSIQ